MKFIIGSLGRTKKNKIVISNDGRRDYQISKIYRAESQAEDAAPFVLYCRPAEYIDSVVERFLSKINSDEVILSYFGGVGISVYFTHSKTRRSRARSGEVELCIRGWGITGYEVLHEMAHSLQGEAMPHHGAVFAGIYLMLVKACMPTDCYDELVHQFEKESVSYRKVTREGLMYGKKNCKHDHNKPATERKAKPKRRAGWFY